MKDIAMTTAVVCGLGTSIVAALIIRMLLTDPVAAATAISGALSTLARYL